MTPSMRAAIADLGLDHLTVIYPGDARYMLGEHTEVLPVAQLVAEGARAIVGRRSIH
jgi:hypothetical protein